MRSAAVWGILREVETWVCVSSLPMPWASELFMSVFVFRADIRLHFCLMLCGTACEKYLALKSVEIVFVFSTVDICHL